MRKIDGYDIAIYAIGVLVVIILGVSVEYALTETVGR